MKILYVGCHGVLEYDEMRMFTEMDSRLGEALSIEIFSLLGAYQNPLQAGDFMRSTIPHGRFYPELYSVALQCDKSNIHPELLDWADVILFMHNAAVPGDTHAQAWLAGNWQRIKDKNKKVIWRSIGQSTPAIERELVTYRAQGLKIVRYSPIENSIPDYAGMDALIRFGKDEDEFNNWNGEKEHVITFAQSFMKRGDHLNYPLFEEVTYQFNRKVFGPENENLGTINGGVRSYQELKQELRDARVFYYFGTVPAPYTLSIMEAMMTGIPVVAVGSGLRRHPAYPWNNYEIPTIIENGVNGFVSDSVTELQGFIRLLLSDKHRAREVGERGRARAIELFGYQSVMSAWNYFLKTI